MGGCVNPGCLYGGAIELDPYEALHKIGCLDGEEAYPTIRIHERAHFALFETASHHSDQLGHEKKIVLKKGIARNLPSFRRNPEHHFQSALGRRVLAYLRDFRVQRGFRDLAFLDVNHQSVIGPNKPDVQTLFEFVPLAPNHDAIAIAVRRRAWNDWRHDRTPATLARFRPFGCGSQPSYPLEQICYLLALN